MVINLNLNLDQVSGLTLDNAFHAVDLSTKVPVGAVVAILEIEATSTSVKTYKIRATGSTDTDEVTVAALADAVDRQQCFVPLDVNRSFEFSGDPTFNMYVVGYLAGANVVTYTNKLLKTQTDTGGWRTVDMTADFGADAGSVKYVLTFGGAISEDKNAIYGVRERGSNLGICGDGVFNLVGVDTDNTFEVYRNCPLKIIGYVKNDSTISNVLNTANPTGLSGGTWNTVSFTSQVSETAKIANIWLYQSISTAGEKKTVRAVGSTNGIARGGGRHLVLLNDSKQAEIYYTTENLIRLVGYFSETFPTSSSAPLPLFFRQ